jgi:hypothetical protein
MSELALNSPLRDRRATWHPYPRGTQGMRLASPECEGCRLKVRPRRRPNEPRRLAIYVRLSMRLVISAKLRSCPAGRLLVYARAGRFRADAGECGRERSHEAMAAASLMLIARQGPTRACSQRDKPADLPIGKSTESVFHRLKPPSSERLSRYALRRRRG